MRFAALIEALRSAPGPVPTSPALAAYLEKVKRHAYQVTDEDVAALKAAGIDEDTIFSATAAAATSAGLERLTAGLKALEE